MPGIGLIARSGRKVGRTHLAFLRGAVQNAPIMPLAERYLAATEDRLDERAVRATLRWLQLEFAGAAALAGQPQLHQRIPFFALATRTEVEHRTRRRLQPLPSGAMSAEEFGERLPENFYTEGEVRELYGEYCREVLRAAGAVLPKLHLQAFSATQQQQALRCIEVLERFLVIEPAADHPVTAWFNQRFAARLAPTGVRTLGELTAFIDRAGRRWYTSLPRIGPARAQRVVEWLGSVGRHPGGELSPLAVKSRTKLTLLDREELHAASGELVPLERLTLPHPLSGEAGANRGVRNRLAAGNDLQAIHEWLAARARNPHTFRAYRREAERLLLWAVVEKGRALSSLTSADCAEYVDFLVALGRPAKAWRWQRASADWLGPKSAARLSPAWRPFEGPLSVRSIETAATILKACCEWLSRQRYLDSNPWDGVKASITDDPVVKAEPLPLEKRRRALTSADWALLQRQLEALGDGETACRQRFIVRFLYMTGLRLHELAAATFGRVQLDDAGRGGASFALRFRGKGGVVRRVPLASAAVAALREYMQARGLGADPTRADLAARPLVARLRRDEAEEAADEGLSASRIYGVLRTVLTYAAGRLAEGGEIEAAARLRQASTHWLRHSFATRSLEHMPLKHVQLLMGHGDIAITGEYISVEAEALREAIERAFATHDGVAAPR